MQQSIVYLTHLSSVAKTQTGSLHEQKLRCSVVLSFTFGAFIRPWTQNRILESVRRKSLKTLQFLNYARAYLRNGSYVPGKQVFTIFPYKLNFLHFQVESCCT